jgi:hypothetical protein
MQVRGLDAGDVKRIHFGEGGQGGSYHESGTDLSLFHAQLPKAAVSLFAEGIEVVDDLSDFAVVDEQEVEGINHAWEFVEVLPESVVDDVEHSVNEHLSLLSKALRHQFEVVLLVESPLESFDGASSSCRVKINRGNQL